MTCEEMKNKFEKEEWDDVHFEEITQEEAIEIANRAVKQLKYTDKHYRKQKFTKNTWDFLQKCVILLK